MVLASGCGCCNDQQHGGTLPRQHRGGIARQRPVGKVIGNVSNILLQNQHLASPLPSPQQQHQILINSSYANDKLAVCTTMVNKFYPVSLHLK